MPLQICWIVNPTLIMPTEMLRIGFPRFWDAYCDTSVRVGLRGAQFGNASHMKQTDDPRFKIGSFF